MLVDVKNFSDYFKSFGKPGILAAPLISYGDPKSRVSRNMTLSEYQAELNAVTKIENISEKVIIECLQNFNLNPYQRSMVAKAALLNKKISLKTYSKFSISLIISRIQYKIKKAQK
jgi:hypothetical protein